MCRTRRETRALFTVATRTRFRRERTARARRDGRDARLRYSKRRIGHRSRGQTPSRTRPDRRRLQRRGRHRGRSRRCAHDRRLRRCDRYEFSRRGARRRVGARSDVRSWERTHREHLVARRRDRDPAPRAVQRVEICHPRLFRRLTRRTRSVRGPRDGGRPRASCARVRRRKRRTRVSPKKSTRCSRRAIRFR